MPVTAQRQFGLILDAATSLLSAAAVVGGQLEGFKARRRKVGVKYKLPDDCPLIIVSGGQRIPGASVFDGYRQFDYEVFAAIVIVGNRQLETDQNDQPDYAEIVTKILSASSLSGTLVWRYEIDASPEYDRSLIPANYDVTPVKVTYTTTETRN